MDERQRRIGGDLSAEPGKLGEADGWIDRIGGPAAPAAQRDDRHADARASIAATKPLRAGGAGDDDRRGGQKLARRGSRKSLGPPSMATMRSKRSAAAPLASARSIAVAAERRALREAAERQQFAAKRDRHGVQPRVALPRR